MTHLEGALASNVKRLEGPVRRETESVLVRAREYVGTLTIEVDPPDAEVSIDGRRIEGGAREPTLLSVGEHLVDVRAPGRLAERRAVTINGGEAHRLEVKLFEPPNTGVSGDLSSNERSSVTPIYKRWWLWTAVAVIAGGAASAVILSKQREVTYREVPQGTSQTPVGPTLHPSYGGR